MNKLQPIIKRRSNRQKMEMSNNRRIIAYKISQDPFHTHINPHSTCPDEPGPNTSTNFKFLV